VNLPETRLVKTRPGTVPGCVRSGLARAGGREVALDQEHRELILRGGEPAAVLLELGHSRAGCSQVLPLGDDAADLRRQRLDGVAHSALVTGRGHRSKIVGRQCGVR
jgi:hypothetical protein